MGAIAFQKDLGAVHSCAHALSTVADLHHGLANGIMIDHVMRFNLPAATDEDGRARARRAGRRAATIGSAEARGPRVHRLARRAEGRRSAFRRRSSDYASTRPVTPAPTSRALVEIAIHDICHQTNPRKCTATDFEQLFAAAF